MSSTLTGPAHILQWAPKFTRKHVTGSLGGEIFALSEMWGHVEMIREFYIALGREKMRKPVIVRLGVPQRSIDCESPLSHRRTERLGTGKFPPGTFGSSWTPLKVEILEMFRGSPVMKTRLTV